MGLDHLRDSRRCHLFEEIAEWVWDEIVDYHQQNVHKDETAITGKIINKIRKAHNNHNVGIWSNLGKYESKFGSDIDIFIETFENEFLWYALQAKVLYRNKRFEGIKEKQQWKKLKHLESIADCLPYYLFYYGEDKQVTTFVDCCKNTLDEKQFGCSLIELKNVESVSMSVSRPKFSDFHPKYTHPWRELVCCLARRTKDKTYSLQQVKNEVELYKGVLNAAILSGETDQLQTEDDNIIVNANKRVGRTPDVSFVVRASSSL